MAFESSKLALALIVLFSMFLSPCFAQRCRNYAFPTDHAFAFCNDPPILNAYLHWNFNSATGKIQIAHRHENLTSSTWVSWAINPKRQRMPGSQALIAYRDPNGTARVFSTAITSYRTSMQERKLSFDVSNVPATFENDEITIFATLRLKKNSTRVNPALQDGPPHGDNIAKHSISGPTPHFMSTWELFFSKSATGTATAGGGIDSRIVNMNIHGSLNVVSWGILMPIGVLIARYMRMFPSVGPVWYYLHLGCQYSAFSIGVAGVFTGFRLSNETKGVLYSCHGIIGILLHCLATLQIFAFSLRPKKKHKYRRYWNIYHRSVGCAVIILSIVNIFNGFDILKPEEKWKYSYTGVIATLGAIAVCLEAFTRFVVLPKKNNQSSVENMPKLVRVHILSLV